MNKEKLQTFVDFFNIDPDSYEFDQNQLLIIKLDEYHRYVIAPLTYLDEKAKELTKEEYDFIMGKLKEGKNV